MLKRNNIIKTVYPITFLFILFCSTVCYAGNLETEFDNVSVPATIGTIANVMVAFALLISVFKLVQIGFKFLTGNMSGKSTQEAKASLIPWVIGVAICCLYYVIGGYVIRTIIGKMDSNIFG